jgi:adenylyl-sulfate kinase
MGCRVEILDGDVVRRELSSELGYSRAHRDLNVSRIGFVAGLLARHGVIAIVAAVSPFAAARAEVRGRSIRFVEVHVDCPLAECERRDVKGMYALARAGRLSEFTGISSPYEPPAAPELRVDTARLTIAESAERVLAKLYDVGMLERR